MLLLLCRWCADQAGCCPIGRAKAASLLEGWCRCFCWGGLLGLGLWASQTHVLWALLRTSEQVLKGKALGLWLSVGGSSRTLLRMKFVGSLAGWRSAPQLRQSCLRGLWWGKWQSARSQPIGTSLPLMVMTAGFPPSLIVGCPPAGPDENTLMATDFWLRLLVLLLPLFAPLPEFWG